MPKCYYEGDNEFDADFESMMWEDVRNADSDTRALKSMNNTDALRLFHFKCCKMRFCSSTGADVQDLVLATVGGTDAHAALLVHRVKAAVRILVVVAGVPDVEGIPSGHGVLNMMSD
eukprot:759441-Hanusia_phi.AAC.1